MIKYYKYLDRLLLITFVNDEYNNYGTVNWLGLSFGFLSRIIISCHTIIKYVLKQCR